MRYPPLGRSLVIASIMILLALSTLLITGGISILVGYTQVEGLEIVELPEPRLEGNMSVEEAIYRRRSIRRYSGEPLSLEELSQILWAAQGITLPSKGFRSAPSAGATYPLILYLVVKEGGVTGLPAGVYRYDPFGHRLVLWRSGDFSIELYRACLEQEWIRDAAVNLVITANFTRTTMHYGERGVRYVYMEAGHVGQNIYLQVTALGLGTVAVGAFYDDWVKRIVACPEDPIYVFPVGRR